ncbi:MAG: CPBP family intramembrane glutamic endopeptidase [Candidatus Saccharimonadales bacterium]
MLGLDIKKGQKDNKAVRWNPWVGVLLVFAIYFLSQIVGLVLLIYPALHHWSATRSTNWLNNSIYAQFVYILIVETFTVLAVLQLLKWFKADKKVIGLRKPRPKDALYTLAAAPVYYVLFILAIVILSSFVKGLNVSETQNVGFNNVHGLAELVVTFISLVLLPPVAEEILVRGFLYTSLKKGLPQIAAAILTSIIFASAHLPEGTKGLLWVGFIDTFILSMVLVYLREKTDGLWSGMLLHAIKNGVAYFVLYLGVMYTFHI